MIFFLSDYNNFEAVWNLKDIKSILQFEFIFCEISPHFLKVTQYWAQN